MRDSQAGADSEIRVGLTGVALVVAGAWAGRAESGAAAGVLAGWGLCAARRSAVDPRALIG